MDLSGTPLLGVHYATVSMWWARYEAGGLDALAAQTRRRAVGASAPSVG